LHEAQSYSLSSKNFFSIYNMIRVASWFASLGIGPTTARCLAAVSCGAAKEERKKGMQKIY